MAHNTSPSDGALVFVTMLGMDGSPANVVGRVVGPQPEDGLWAVKDADGVTYRCAPEHVHVIRIPTDVGYVITWLVWELEARERKLRMENEWHHEMTTAMVEEFVSDGIDVDAYHERASRRLYANLPPPPRPLKVVR